MRGMGMVAAVARVARIEVVRRCMLSEDWGQRSAGNGAVD